MEKAGSTWRAEAGELAFEYSDKDVGWRKN